MPDTEMMDELAQFDQEFAEAEAAEGGSRVPDGTYQVIVDALRIGRWENSGSPYAEWELRVLNGEYEGRDITSRRTLDNKAQYPFFKAELAMVGLESMERLSDLPLVAKQAIGQMLEVRVKTNKKDDKTYTNVYFNKNLGGGVTDAFGDAPPF